MMRTHCQLQWIYCGNSMAGMKSGIDRSGMRESAIALFVCMAAVFTMSADSAVAAPSLAIGARRSAVLFEQDGLEFEQRSAAPNVRLGWTFSPLSTVGFVGESEVEHTVNVLPLASLSVGGIGRPRLRQGNAGEQRVPRDGVPLGVDLVGFVGTAIEWQRDPLGVSVSVGPAASAEGYLRAKGSLSAVASYYAAGGLVRGELQLKAGELASPFIGLEAAGLPFGGVRGTLRSLDTAWHSGVDIGVRLTL